MQIDLSQLITAEDKMAAAWASLRVDRDARLRASDWAVLPDADPQPNLQSWLNYRQALRDLPTVTEDPSMPNWPPVPGSE